MVKILFYLISIMIVCLCLSLLPSLCTMPQWYQSNLLLIKCSLIGCIGGILYCIRGIYLNKCVRKQWDIDWHIWYYLRPLASCITGVISAIFLKAVLLVLDTNTTSDSSIYGYLAIAFIAGYNVDNFMKKLEEIALSIWGIKKTNSSLNNNEEDNKG